MNKPIYQDDSMLLYKDNIAVWQGKRDACLVNKEEALSNLYYINSDSQSILGHVLIFIIMLICTLTLIWYCKMHGSQMIFYLRDGNFPHWMEFLGDVFIAIFAVIGLIQFSIFTIASMLSLYGAIRVKSDEKTVRLLLDKGTRFIGRVTKIEDYNKIHFRFIDESNQQRETSYTIKGNALEYVRKHSRVAILKYKNNVVLL